MELWKQIKKYGTSLIMRIDKEEKEILELQEGDVLQMKVKRKYSKNEDIQLPKVEEKA